MNADSRLENEQIDLLITIVDAYRFGREPFLVLRAANALGHIFVSHPALKAGPLSTPEHDLQMLVRENYLHITDRGGTSSFVPTPEGRELYRRHKTAGEDAVKHVENEVRSFLSADEMNAYPRALAAWKRAEAIYWQDDAADRLTDVGHHCREAIQAFASELAAKHSVTNIDPDPEKTINRVAAVLQTNVGESVAEFLDALLRYWKAVNALVQRQVHAGKKERRPIDLEDARLVVFQTLLVMYEVHRAISRK